MLCEYADATEKVTIIPRGQALGVTFTPPEKGRAPHQPGEADRQDLRLPGRPRGRESIFIGKIHGGAYADIKTVTSLARMMVTQLGMSDLLGPILL